MPYKSKILYKSKRRYRRVFRNDPKYRGTDIMRAGNLARVSQMATKQRLNVHSFKRLTVGANIAAPTGAELNQAMTFQLSDVPGVADFTGLYDQYRICAVKCTFRPQCQQPVYGAQFMGAFYTTLDFDDNTPITSDAIRQTRYMRQHTITPDKPFTRFLKPRTLNEIYRSAVTTAYTIRSGKNPWIDLATNDVPHYGLKYAWTQASVAMLIIVDVTYYFQMRNPR